jgi:hypothetical protein
MKDSPTIAAVRRFLAIATEGDPPTMAELARALDELAMAYHESPEGEASGDESKAPERDYIKLREALAARFPDFGYYSVSDPTDELAETPPLLGDAIDDLADIIRDLEDVLWTFENVGPGDAHWDFRFSYTIHWGRHLRELALYLHAHLEREPNSFDCRYPMHCA